MPILEYPIFIFSGASRVGKTSLARKVASALGVSSASFGDYVRSQATLLLNERMATRQQLQDIGQKLVMENPELLCCRVLAAGGFTPGRPMILDGLRHFRLVPVLQKMSPGAVLKLVYVEATQDLRIDRWDGEITRSELANVDSHPVEAELMDIRDNADLIVDTRQGLEQCFRIVIEWIVELYPYLGVDRCS
jgi:adenylate kinase family enzyme